MGWTLVYDAGAESLPLGGLLTCLGLLVAFPAVLWLRSQSSRPVPPFVRNIMLGGLAILVVGIGIPASLHGLWRDSELREVARAGAFEVTEGPVVLLDAMPHSGHKLERVSIGGVEFEYSDFSETVCFHNAVSHGGVLKDGVMARAGYRDNCILRVEIRTDGN